MSAFVCALMLNSCAAILGRPEPGIIERERVLVCFRQSEQGHAVVTIRPDACHSMRCAHPEEVSGTALLDRREFRIDFDPYFHFTESKPLFFPCADDCAGAGTLQFDLGVLDVGLYQVHVRDHYLGDLSVTSGLAWVDQCLATVP